ncbi:ABC-type amino acid transport substrate-binding protein [Marinobacter sp. es.042]|uniref:substrate-binding periplasmic protein n=1 Tax=Marinobacter sp. es.042 TaxID=1761794 RepID=UPI000B50C360|nr:transporter substrate-binding domain-containing protein [Marinobacter sp. es.042]SNB57377.1 ABC-type amino acid transport substrate-binding protein [Marinobacter sp. es.042]
MPRIVWLRIFHVFLFLFFSLSLSADSKRQHIVGVFADIEREISVENGKLVGRFAPYYRCVFSRVDGDFRFVNMPLAQILRQLEKGGISIGLPLIQTVERDQYADFGGTLFQLEYVYLMVQDLPPLDSMTGLRFGFVRKFAGLELLKGDSPQVTHVSDWEQAVRMLRLGRVDVVVLPRIMMDLYLEDYQGAYYDRTAAWIDLSMYISHSVEDNRLKEDFRDAIRTCRLISEKNYEAWDIPGGQRDPEG